MTNAMAAGPAYVARNLETQNNRDLKEEPMATKLDRENKRVRRRKSDQIEFRVIFMLSFIVFLLAAAGERCLPWNWIGAGGEAKKTILASALESARTVVPYAFMG